jgi:hypothetical protein
MASLFNSSGILCYYGFRSVRQLWNSDFATGSMDCRKDAYLEFIDYPFATNPTLCITVNNTDLFTTQPGVQMTFLGKLPDLAPFDAVTYGIRKPEEQYEPLLSNYLTLGLNTRSRFKIELSHQIKDCNATAGGQPKCLSNFQQSCIEQACNCTYPVITDDQAADLAEQIPGSCAKKNLEGTCNYNSTGFLCPPGLGGSRAIFCTLDQICGSKAAQHACPLPSCDDPTFPQISTFTPIDNRVLDGAAGIDANTTEALRGVFLLSVILESQTITIVQEVLGYTALSYFGSVGGMMGLLLGFSMLTIMEWVEGCCKIGKKVEEAAVDEVVDILTDDDDEQAEKAAAEAARSGQTPAASATRV